MKTLIFIALTLLLFTNIVIGQADPPFSKCSYVCGYYGPVTFHSGTCFFYKKGQKTFIISCSHVFTGVETYTGTRQYTPDTLTIFYIGKDSHTTKPFKVQLNLKRLKYFAYYDKPDLTGFEVHLPKDFDINFINDYINTSYFDKVPDEVYFYGYPSPMQHWGTQNGLLVTGNYSTDFKSIVSDDPIMKISTPAQVQIILQKIKPFTFLISQAARHGMSGSPVFGKFHQKNKMSYYFIGVVSGTYVTLNKSIAINGRAANKYFLNDMH